MILPKMLKVGSHQISVVFPHHFRERSDVCGQYDQSLSEIRVDHVDACGNMRSDSSILVTFLHEVLHAIDYTYNRGRVTRRKDGEDDIDQLAQGLAQVLRDNDGLACLIKE